MTVREFAERVLFGATLEEKLAPPPGGMVDEGRGEGIATPESPGRPGELRLRDDGVRADFPGAAGVEDEAQRGRLLHFFANHELLATELMALVLLKFPGAPDAFRAGIVRTLKEEQMHTKLYLKRMAECGVGFGELPVNGFFWRTVAPMSSPLDYVTRLSLTFEQANLDYARGYAKVFAEAGDAETAALLERIYRDEIGHVHYGLSWFRRWKARRDESDWKAFVSQLDFPLSAARAKGGFAFNEEGRREAGLDEEFIRELKVFSQSKGRTPNVFWFNPGAEESVAPGWDGTVSAAAQQIGRDLALLPAFLSRSEDIVIVPEVPPAAHLESLLEAGMALPEFVALSEIDSVAERNCHEMRPWARTPDAQETIGRLGASCDLTAPALFSKDVHAELLRGLVKTASCPLLCDAVAVGVAGRSLEEVADWLANAPRGRCVLKAPFSTAGRERLIRDSKAPLIAAEQEWIETMLRKQGALVIEPWLDRTIDFSIQYDFEAERGLRRRGLVVMDNTAHGQFRGATVASRFTRFLDSATREALYSGSTRRGHLLAFLDDELEPALADLLESYDYGGPLGVDAFFYRNQAGEVRLKPVVEINPRYTMGRVALELARFGPQNAVTTLAIGKTGASAPRNAIRLTPEREGGQFVAWLSVG